MAQTPQPSDHSAVAALEKRPRGCSADAPQLHVAARAVESVGAAGHRPTLFEDGDAPPEGSQPPTRRRRSWSSCTRSYQIFEAIDTPDSFIFVEEWESLDGLYSHFHTAHFTEFFGALGEVLAGAPEGSVHELASTQTLDETFAAAGIGG
jgi:Antibiotic biosynthesis monooxygenase